MARRPEGVRRAGDVTLHSGVNFRARTTQGHRDDEVGEVVVVSE